jgi:hypothetical protein
MRKRISSFCLVFGVLVSVAVIGCGGDKKSIDQPTSTPQTNSQNEREGWKTFQAGVVEFMLPPSFEGGSKDENIDASIRNLRRQGQNDLANSVEISRKSLDLLAIGTDRQTLGSSVTVLATGLPAQIPTDTIVAEVKDRLPAATGVSQTTTFVSSPKYPATKLSYEINLSGVPVRATQYLIRWKGDLVVISYSAAASKFKDLELLFQLSINSLKLKE